MQFFKHIVFSGSFFVLLFVPLNTHALTIGPVKFNFSGESGEVLQDTIMLFNEGEYPLELTAQISNVTFAPGGRGQPIPTAIAGPNNIADWIQSEQTAVKLDSKERKAVSFTITIPSDAPPGGYYAQIAWSPLKKVGSEIKLIESLASLVLLRVEGEVEEAAIITFFGSQGNPTRFEKMPIPLSVQIKNTGTVHAAPSGEIRLLNANRAVVNRIPFNQGTQAAYILPGETRRFDLEWKNGFRFGKYTAVLDLLYGESLQELHGEYTFWIIPTYLLFAWLGVAVFVVIACFGLLKKCYSSSRSIRS